MCLSKLPLQNCDVQQYDISFKVTYYGDVVLFVALSNMVIDLINILEANAAMIAANTVDIVAKVMG